MGFPIEPRISSEPPTIRPTAIGPPISAKPFAETTRADRLARWIAVGFGLGYAPVAPGTAGSLLGVGLFLSISMSPPAAAGSGPLGPWGVALGYGLGVMLFAAVGQWAAGRAEVGFGKHDDGRIVIDEVVGQMIALLPLLGVPAVWASVGATEWTRSEFFCWVVTGFVLFRLFDVWKPGAIGWAERHFNGGLGVMADDILAGFYAALGLILSLAVRLAVGRSISLSMPTAMGANA